MPQSLLPDARLTGVRTIKQSKTVPFGADVTDRLARHLSRTPDTARALFVAPNASIQGDVILGENSSVFYGAVLRGDIAEIRIGAGTNIQDNAIVHLADDLDATIGDYCTIGHAAIVHACTIGDECLVGMGATVLDGAVVGAHSIIGANSLVPQGMQIPKNSMVYGTPAKVIRPLREEELLFLKQSALKYIAVARAHAALNAKTEAV